ncbi:YraN family protein [Ponticaulis sp.]|uniref:YraN family protein n=1 Tax=Ponticaulis sp. TaxID=2020902 RepID=UPI000B6B8DA4|nr:hypothetical protein [Ponticaulis sp.]OUX98412.1 MAG: hypothetical protein CBB65_11620 [Hyphomonadaceae bacterium TMED5]|tara:strand:+ start:49321 stop:49707 length:387 start_codon:yes stop_codon:yes gene_type:complete
MPRGARQKAEAAGRFAEHYAEFILFLKGYRTLGRREKLPSGELDLVCRKGDLIVIVEVKKRKTFELGAEAVPASSWQRIGRAADLYLARGSGQYYNSDRRYDLFIVLPGLRFCHIHDAWRPDFPLTHG